jgi:MIP family channel proteins
MNDKLIKQLTCEFIGTFALCFIGIGAIHNSPGLLGVALAHGLTIAVFASAFGAISGGQFNPAVSFALLVSGHMDFKKTITYIIAQLAGATAAGFLCASLFSAAAVAGGTPDIAMTPTAVVSTGQAITIEAILTFFLVAVIYGTAVDARAPKIGGLAIGLTVALDILFAGPITGAAMNPARFFGPALAVGHWNNAVVYFAGPLLGGLLAGLVYGRFLIREK